MSAHRPETAALADAGGQTASPVGSSPPDRAAGQPQPKPAVPRRITPRLDLPPCDVCRGPLDDGVNIAYAAVDLSDASRYAIRLRRWHETGSVGPRPPRAEWQLIHGSCAPNRDWTPWVRVPVAELRTDRQTLRRTLSISSQPWYRSTDWEALVSRILAANR
jgi:hypothetical protein